MKLGIKMRIDMITKEMIKNEIDKMPIELVKPVYQYIKNEEKKIDKPKISTLKLGGVYDEKDIREVAYE